MSHALKPGLWVGALCVQAAESWEGMQRPKRARGNSAAHFADALPCTHFRWVGEEGVICVALCWF